MATEAQIAAHRLNAEKSTGPRTPEGKEKASQNSLKHGLLAREGVIRGEDPEEYEIHRAMLLEELAPAGPLEVILATRIVGLFWRLGRAGQNQNEVFGALHDRFVARQAARAEADPRGGAGPGGAGVPPSNRRSETLKTRGQDARSTDESRGRDGREAEAAEQRGTLLGRMTLEDFEHEAVLERLQRYERRIESSLCRNLKELRHVHDQGRKADQEVAGTLARWRQEDGEARKARAFACEPPPEGWPAPAGGTTNTPGAGDDCGFPDDGPEQPMVALVPEEAGLTAETCKTNPIHLVPTPRGLADLDG